jgi:membrane-bound serine protease (ClpP class)
MKRVLPFIMVAILVCLAASPVEAVALADRATLFGNTSFADSFSNFFNNPDIAYLFLALAILGVLVEVTAPGIFIPGTVGVISAIIAFYSLSMLPVNALGLAIFVLALPLLIFGAYKRAVFIPLTILGVAALIVGSIYLFSKGLSVHPALVATVVLIMSIVFIFVSNRVFSAQRLKVSTGREDLIGQTAQARTPLNPGGTVMVEGELWQAYIDHGVAEAGDKLTVSGVKGLKLTVTKQKGGR